MGPCITLSDLWADIPISASLATAALATSVATAAIANTGFARTAQPTALAPAAVHGLRARASSRRIRHRPRAPGR